MQSRLAERVRRGQVGPLQSCLAEGVRRGRLSCLGRPPIVICTPWRGVCVRVEDGAAIVICAQCEARVRVPAVL